MSTSFKDMVWLTAGGDAIAAAIDHGMLSYEEMEQANIAYAAVVSGIEQEWPPDRVESLLRDVYRQRCTKYLDLEKTLELDNRDARQRGMSFNDRKIFTVKIETVRRLFERTRHAGMHIKRHGITATAFIRPLDIPIIEKHGFESHLMVQSELSPTGYCDFSGENVQSAGEVY